MKLIGWNCRGICHALTVRAFKAQIKGARPDLIFLSETKASASRMDFVRNSIKFDHMFVVEEKGKAGGLCMLWKDGMSVKEVEYNKNLIAVKISDLACEWLLDSLVANTLGRKVNATIKRRLDRGIANILWRLVYPKATLSHLGTIGSDHTPIVLDTSPQAGFAHRPFRFEVAWLRDERCTSVIDSAWNDEPIGSDFIKLCKKQAATRDALKKWHKEVFGRCQDRINSLMQRIKDIQRQPPSNQSGELEAALQAKLAEWLLRSEALWRQKSRELWLKLGDKNSKIFHFSTIVGRKRNSIDAIRDGNGSWITEGNSIRKTFLDHFKELF
ncbi:uncharacterized protein LOC142620111 [Castanea sativa]|uniref:uncharacterized protein LOC142620111 n=1 Tax=Castanea sativa TaxID=21020 RepID=UPI003F65346B